MLHFILGSFQSRCLTNIVPYTVNIEICFFNSISIISQQSTLKPFWHTANPLMSKSYSTKQGEHWNLFSTVFQLYHSKVHLNLSGIQQIQRCPTIIVPSMVNIEIRFQQFFNYITAKLHLNRSGMQQIHRCPIIIVPNTVNSISIISQQSTLKSFWHTTNPKMSYS